MRMWLFFFGGDGCRLDDPCADVNDCIALLTLTSSCAYLTWLATPCSIVAVQAVGREEWGVKVLACRQATQLVFQDAKAAQAAQKGKIRLWQLAQAPQPNAHPALMATLLLLRRRTRMLLRW